MKGKDGDKNHLSPNDHCNIVAKDGRISPALSWRPSSARSSRMGDEEESKALFRQYVKKSWDDQLHREREAQKKLDKNNGKAVAHLVDGELKFEEDEEESKKTRDPALQEGNILPDELGDEFPNELFGKPLEEIDKYIKDKVNVQLWVNFGFMWCVCFHLQQVGEKLISSVTTRKCWHTINGGGGGTYFWFLWGFFSGGGHKYNIIKIKIKEKKFVSFTYLQFSIVNGDFSNKLLI